MTTITLAAPRLPDVHPCPSWCDGVHEPMQYPNLGDQHVGRTGAAVGHTLEPEMDDDASVYVEQYVYIEDGVMHVSEPLIQVKQCECTDGPDAVALALLLVRAAELLERETRHD